MLLVVFGDAESEAGPACADSRRPRLWRDGRGGARPRRPWRCAPGSFWRGAVGGSNHGVAPELGVSLDTVSKWWSRFAERRLQGLTDELWPGRPAQSAMRRSSRVVTATLEQAPPSGDTHWSAWSMAAAHGLADLADFRAQAVRHPELETVHRPAVHRQGPRCRRLVQSPARARPGAVRGREVPDPGLLTGPPRSCRCCPRPRRE